LKINPLSISINFKWWNKQLGNGRKQNPIFSEQNSTVSQCNTAVRSRGRNFDEIQQGKENILELLWSDEQRAKSITDFLMATLFLGLKVCKRSR